jgi:RNA polymerase-binding transcription factor DksA
MANPAPKKSAPKVVPAKKEVAQATEAAVTKKAPAKAEAAKKATTGTAAAVKKAAAATAPVKRAASPFDAKFLEGQREQLLEERAKLLGSAERLEGEAASLMEDLDPGDVQFDDESGEGDSLVVERERDLALSAQARQTITDIDAALQRIVDGTYGFSTVSGKAIPKERLKAIPWATELVEEKVGGLGTRR